MSPSQESRGIVWIASYPKSGNTWTRMLLTNYLNRNDEPADINALIGKPNAAVREIFDDLTGLESSDLTKEEIDNYRPDFYRQLSKGAKRLRFVKVHDAYRQSSKSGPLFPSDATYKVIYLLRNPLDVACSFAHHSNWSMDFTVKYMGDGGSVLVASTWQIACQLEQILLTWSQHVKSWVDNPELLVLPVRYEDLKSDTPGTFRRVLEFLDFEVEQEKLLRAVEFSSFNEARNQEVERGFHEKTPVAETFFRKGLSGGWKEELTDETASKLIADHAEVMRQFGYLDGQGKSTF